MIEFLISLFPAMLLIYGIHILFQEGHLLEKVGNWIREHWPEKLQKPTIQCPICMSSLWGGVSFFLVQWIFGFYMPLDRIIPYILCLSGLNTIVNKLISKDVNVTIDDDNT